MKMVFTIIAIVLFFEISYSAPANNKRVEKEKLDHVENPTVKTKNKMDDHDENEKSHEEHGSDDREKENQDEHKDQHAESDHASEAEENTQVGPDKGILEASGEKGFKLSPEAFLNFGIKTMRVKSKDSIDVPESSIVTSGPEINIFRLRNGFFKRIDFKQVSQKNRVVIIKSSELIENDEVVIEGIGFLRIAELAAFGGAPEGHSH